jgi:fused signal recognition particle receptor
VLAVQRELDLPVKLVGLGEDVEDLAPFDPDLFVEGLFSHLEG